MADPVTIALVASLAGAAVSGVGAIQQGKAAANAANYNAALAANNAKIALNNANTANLAGEQQAAVQEQKTRAQVSSEKTAQAAGGIDVNSGSAVDVRSSAAANGELNALTIRSNAAREAYGYQTQSASQTAQGELDKSQAKNDITSSYITAGGDLLSAAGNAGMQYANWSKTNGNNLTTGDIQFEKDFGNTNS